MTTLKTQEVIELTAQDTSLTPEMIEKQLQYLDNWQAEKGADGYQLKRTFAFDTFREATRFVHAIGEKTTNEKHNPHIHIVDKAVTVTWWTAAVRGLHQNDFIMAATTDECYEAHDPKQAIENKLDEALDESFPASDSPTVPTTESE